MNFSVKLNYIPTDILCASGGTSNILPEPTEVPDTIIGDASSSSYEESIERIGGFHTEPIDVKFLKWLEEINPQV